jgi:hypothetical protein
VAAFVTFNNEASKSDCLDDYRTSGGRLARLLQPQGLRFEDRRGKVSGRGWGWAAGGGRQG